MINLYPLNAFASKIRPVWSSGVLLLLFMAFSASVMKAQVSSYIFTQSSGSFTSIGGGTVLGTATANSTTATSLRATSFPLTLPFSFNFNNQNYTNLTVASNGYVTFGAGAATGTTPISSTVAWDGSISAWGRDINAVFNVAGKTGNISWTVEGTAPNRVAVIQWENFRPTYTTSTTSAFIFSFQIRLAETTNVISTVYSAGSILIGTGAYSSTNAQIGLRGATNADFNNRTNPATVAFANSNTGTANNDGQSFNTLVTPPGMPADGLTYTWTPSTCIQPSAVTVNNVTTTSATVSWTAPATPPANGYDVYYSTSDTSPNTTTTPSFSGVAGLSQILNLNPGTQYYVWVRSVCNGTEASSWTLITGFVTICVPVTYMYENFDSYETGSTVPICWERIISGTGTQTINSTTPNSGTRNLYQFSGYAANQTIVVLPVFSNVNAGTNWIRLKARVTAAPRTIEFGYVTDVADANTFVLLESKVITNTLYSAADSEYTFSVPASVPANARLAIKNPGTQSTTLYYDDVYWEPAPPCLAPINLTASNVAPTTATLSWGASPSTPANGYDVYYSITNTAPVATTVPNHANVASLSQNLVGLTAATTYYVWVRSVCSSTSMSSWEQLLSFTTPCNPVATMFENFDSYGTGSIVPDCWDSIIIGSGTQTISSTDPNSGTRNLYQYSSTAFNQSIVVLPPFSNVNAGTHWLRLKARVTAAPRIIEFGYVTDPADANSFVLVESKSISNTTYADPSSEYTFSLPPTVPANARVAIKNPGGSATVTFYYDDVYWEVAPTCFAPANVVVTGITANSATVSWNAPITVPGNGYDIYYSTTNTAPTASTVPNITAVNGLSATISGLTPSTNYFVWVRSSCSAADKSAWSEAATFSSSCLAPAITSVSSPVFCPGQTTTITATADAGATINWYNTPTGGTAVGTGTSYTTPVLMAPTSYYVTASSGGGISTVGPVNPSALGVISSSNYAIGTYYQIFDVTIPTTLISIDVFPVSSVAIGTASAIEIRNSAGTTLLSVPYTVTVNDGVTPQTVALNYALPVGTGFRIGQGTGINLQRNTSGTVYPVVSSAITVTGNNFSSGPDYWYYIYNWKFSSSCESVRQQVNVTLDPACPLAVENISLKDIDLAVYPNPVSSVLYLKSKQKVTNVDIFSAAGAKLMSIGDKNITSLNLESLITGVYLVNITLSDGQKVTKKIIKK